jgi:hypothetical protein
MRVCVFYSILDFRTSEKKDSFKFEITMNA